MTLISCAPDNADLLSLVMPYEKLAVGFVSHLLRGDSHFFLLRSDDGQACDAFSLSDGGQIFHCLPDAYGVRRKEVLELLKDFFASHRDHDYYNVIGEEKGSDLIKEALVSAAGQKVQHEEHYELLEKKTDPAGLPATLRTMRDEYEKLALVRCNPDMLESLLPLQIAYEKEEVLWQNESLDPHVTRLSFHHALRNQQIFALVKNGHFVAKGGTNALGKKYVQLGGIYTLPSERKKGYATEILNHISAEMQAQGKKMVLFAKTKNEPALRLYEKCGFCKIGRFEIAYF